MTSPSTDPASNSTDEPMSMKERLIAIVIGLALLGYGVATWMYPDWFVDADPSGRGGRKVKLVLWLVWNRPLGTIGGLFGAMALLASLLPKSKKAENEGKGAS